jgi:GTPase SAR1 family protein
MSQLKVLEIRKRLSYLCDFFEHLVSSYDLVYRDGMTQSGALAELGAIREMTAACAEFTIAFVGEYAAGKTTLINLLTNSDMKTGTSTTTEQAAKLSWHNITIVDTPGLGSGFDEHDAVTKEWLAKADLLVYVLTPDLFDRHAGERFTKILDEFKRDHELMLVMNMIDKEGNPIEVYEEELQAVLDPRPIEDYHPCFISADYQEKSRNPMHDKEDREYYAEKSRYDSFVQSIDEFILDRREKASLSTPLTRLQVLSRKMGFKNRFDQENALLDRQRAVYDEALIDLKGAMSDFSEVLKSFALMASGDIFTALDMPGGDLADQFKKIIDRFVENIASAVDSTCQRVSDVVGRLQDKSEEISHSDLFAQVQERVATEEILQDIFKDFTVPGRIDTAGRENIITKLRNSVSEVEGISGVGAPEAFKDALNAKNAFDLSAKLAAKVDRKVVLAVGRKIGYKFKPWEAVKLSSKFAKAVPILSVAGAAWEVVSSIQGKKKQEDKNRQLREFKQDVRGLLDRASGETICMLDKMLAEPIRILTMDAITLLEDKKQKLLKYSEESQEKSKELEERRSDCVGLYELIYETGPQKKD